jgi:hypothetical protein
MVEAAHHSAIACAKAMALDEIFSRLGAGELL